MQSYDFVLGFIEENRFRQKFPVERTGPLDLARKHCRAPDIYITDAMKAAFLFRRFIM